MKKIILVLTALGILVIFGFIYFLYLYMRPVEDSDCALGKGRIQFITWCEYCKKDKWSGGSLSSEIITDMEKCGLGISLKNGTSCINARDVCSSYGVR